MLNAGLHIIERTTLALATVLVRKGKSAGLATRVRERFGIELPREPRRAVAGDITFAGTAPGAWLATCENADGDFAALLAESLDGLASISDQSDGLIVVGVSGPNVRDALCKLVPIDIHPRAFAVNQVAVTIAAHMPITMWRLPDDSNRTPTFEIATFRSFAESFRHALAESAMEFGVLR
jgi:methylglutamate dehydrogenase subunit D